MTKEKRNSTSKTLRIRIIKVLIIVLGSLGISVGSSYLIGYDSIQDIKPLVVGAIFMTIILILKEFYGYSKTTPTLQ